MANIRYSRYSGLFYPANKQHIFTSVDYYLHSSLTLTERPKAMIVPHAGYLYSGDVAGSAYSTLSAHADSIDQVLLLAPAHKNAFEGICLTDVETYELPTGMIQTDQTIVEHLVDDYDSCFINNEFHEEEYAIELQIPFLQSTLKQFKLIPVLIGQTSAKDIYDLLYPYLFNENMVIIATSDLSHYLPHDQAVKTDQYTSQAIEALDTDQLTGFHACGYQIIQGLSKLAQKNNLSATAIDVRNAYQVTGKNPERVVGYGAYLYF